jgi:Ca2+/H+ antiporter
MAKKHKKAPLTWREKAEQEKSRRAERQKKYPELTALFSFGMVFMVLYIIAWPLSSHLQLPLNFYMSLLMYLLIGTLLWRRPDLVIGVITRNKSDLADDDPHILKAVKRMRQAGVVLLLLGIVLIAVATNNLVHNLGERGVGV